MPREVDYELESARYNGPKKPNLPAEFVKREIRSLRLLAHKVVSQRRANETDFAFLADKVTFDNCPEINGYNTRLCSEQGQSPQPKTKAGYLQLIDMPAADPDTIMTAMKKEHELTR